MSGIPESLSLSLHIYIYICIEREREREIHTYTYIYIYRQMYRYIARYILRNYLYYDMMQFKLGSCRQEDIAVRASLQPAGQL